MAISQLYPRKTMRRRTRQQSMAERHKYDQKPVKTNDGEWGSSYMCLPETAAEEFEISKKIYTQLTGRKQSPEHDNIMYLIIQSFKPGEISPEKANRLGYELAMKFTKGQHQFVAVSYTHPTLPTIHSVLIFLHSSCFQS